MNVVILSGLGQCPDAATLSRQACALVAYPLGLSTSTRELTMLLDPRYSYDNDLVDKVEAAGAFCLAGSEYEHWASQMAAVAAFAPSSGRGKHPLLHVVLSWQSHEAPDALSAEQAVRQMRNMIGAADLQTVWALHKNTHNRHVHVTVNRVHPASLQIVELAEGWLEDALHQAAAVIAVQGGWALEPNALYRANPAGCVWHRATGRLVRDASGRQLREKGDRALELEIQRKNPSWATARELINSSCSWTQLHRALARQGMSYFAVGPGASIALPDGQIVKASTLDSEAGFGRLVDRLGPFERDPDTSALDARWESYRAIRQRYESIISRIPTQLESVDQESERPSLPFEPRESVRNADRFQLLLTELTQALRRALEASARTKKVWMQRGQPVDVDLLPLSVLIGKNDRRPLAQDLPSVPVCSIAGATIVLDTAKRPIGLDLGRLIFAAPATDRDRAALMQVASVGLGSITVVAPADHLASWRAAAPRQVEVHFVDRADDKAFAVLTQPITWSAPYENDAKPVVQSRPVVPPVKEVPSQKPNIAASKAPVTVSPRQGRPFEAREPLSLQERLSASRLKAALDRYPPNIRAEHPLAQQFLEQLRSAPRDESELFDIVSQIRRDPKAASACYAIPVLFFDYKTILESIDMVAESTPELERVLRRSPYRGPAR